MKKLVFILISLILINISLLGNDSVKIDKSSWSVIYVDSEELTGEGANNGNAIHCFDEDPSTFWHTEWKNSPSDYPHEIQIDLGDSYNINGFSILTRAATKNGRINDFRFYVTNDPNNWGTAQVAGQIQYPNPQSSEQQTASVFFGTVAGRYIRLQGFNALEGNKHVMIAELDIYQDTVSVLTGQNNQIIEVTSIGTQYSTNQPITLDAIASSGLPIQYEIVSGPATVEGSTITLTGEGGLVVFAISQAGNDNFYPVYMEMSFLVINLNDYYPVITTKLTNAYPIQMSQLMPYLLHSSVSIEHSDSLSIVSLSYKIGETQVEAINVNGDYQFWWTPSEFAFHNIEITAIASNGNSVSESILVEVSNDVEDIAVITLEDAIIDVGTIGSQWYYGSYELPQFVGVYDSIVANFSVSCPNVPGGCDDWDRIAWIQFKDPYGNWVELFRYITPYGVACNHSIDVTDYASLLQGKIDFRVYIETWGTGGWQMDLFLNYYAGETEYPYSFIEELWQGNYNFGDPAKLQPMDTVSIDYYNNIGKATLRLVTTGHGWGDNNTGNAAEFYHAVHDLKINGENRFVQDLWQICNPNPDGCTGQQGTWYHNRAGWCPGLIARPYFYDLTPYLEEAPFDLEYIFQTSYVDNCHPNNPNCISGITCQNCNESYNPHYRISGYLIRYSKEPIKLAIEDENYSNREIASEEIDFEIYPNPTDGKFRINMKTENTNLVCSIINVTGETIRTYFFKNSDEISEYLFDISSLTKEIYFFKIYTKKGINAKKILLK